jgi:lipoic acid synthetase
MREERLHTVCEEAHCPNIGECWTAGTATFMILGDTCTRACAFCAVKTGRPTWLDEDEPRRVAESIARMGILHAVITSVDRDDLPDGGARMFAETIIQTRRLCPQTSIEVLIPDFQGNWKALEAVMAAQPEILNHNVETVRRLYAGCALRPTWTSPWSCCGEPASSTLGPRPRPVSWSGWERPGRSYWS